MSGTYLVCMRVTDLAEPHVPSKEVGCTRCGLPVWASEALLGESLEPVLPLCFPCAAATVPDQPLEVTEALRAELHGAGLTDADIEETKAVAEDTLRRIRGRLDD